MLLVELSYFLLVGLFQWLWERLFLGYKPPAFLIQLFLQHIHPLFSVTLQHLPQSSHFRPHSRLIHLPLRTMVRLHLLHFPPMLFIPLPKPLQPISILILHLLLHRSQFQLILLRHPHFIHLRQRLICCRILLGLFEFELYIRQSNPELFGLQIAILLGFGLLTRPIQLGFNVPHRLVLQFVRLELGYPAQLVLTLR